MSIANDAEERRTPGRARRLWLAASLCLIAMCGVPTLRFGLLAGWDDRVHVLDNAAVVSPSRATMADHLLTPQLGYPIPVTVATYSIEHALFGMNPFALHMTNLLIQLLVCALCFGLATRLGLSAPGAALSVLLFALHPATAEPVSWISGRKDLLAAGFGVGSVWLALGRTRTHALGSVLCYALALLSKPAAAPLAALAVLASAWFPTAPFAPSLAPEHRRWSLMYRAVPYALVLVPIAILGVLGQARVGAVGTIDATSDGVSLAQRVWYALGHHLSVLFLWEETTVKYFPEHWPPTFTPRIDLAPLVLLAGVAAATSCSHPSRRRLTMFGTLWGFLAYLPSSGLFFGLTRFLADSYLYLPLIGVGLVAGALFDSATHSVRPRLAAALQLLPCLCFVLLAPSFLISSARFADDERLWAHARARFPNHPRICRQWANAIVELHGPGPGLAATDQCIARFGPALFVRNRAIVLSRLGRHAESDAWLRRKSPGSELPSD